MNTKKRRGAEQPSNQPHDQPHDQYSARQQEMGSIAEIDQRASCGRHRISRHPAAARRVSIIRQYVEQQCAEARSLAPPRPKGRGFSGD